ncbi:cysteine dioxygenase family protein [Umezakia ovalisporum]|jgi:predicted metal-dependent enzyme (double-stranded beta helix superfamily)|uniref:Cupin n=2 Tax=Umezakia ovalisporum TaxID=75695 RepID=A0AA43GZ03_9CYAN|nr:cupin [Umezakia ovalisporum]MBI1241590.1 cupin [Nostoc sp. RI_552]MDH6057660.1 cupin [Umezakia ovalisporum FSS-43]MDH6063543.1 cupin [Umezakia ovalisporum FSS-62]MDH6066010.1 cupin [Umezakia ovalisporum APH033B]MDH6072468.1 cupin [Umezakia ovalisporum CobakiLakeA]
MSKGQDWLVTGDGKYQPCKSLRTWDLLKENYRLYRFLTEVEDVLHGVEDESSRLPEIRMLVRRLIVNSYWVQTQYLQPCAQKGNSVLLLYDELGFPLTVQTVTFAPGSRSTIHNHGTWGVVAVLKGQEKNTFWRRIHSPDFLDQVAPTGEITLFPGDIISLTPDAIHSVEAIGEEPTVTFNVYGETDPDERFEFDLVTHKAKKF